MGHISVMKQIPDFYVSFVLRYIIQIARAFAHAHKNNLVHGNFNLTKVVVQKPPALEKKVEKDVRKAEKDAEKLQRKKELLRKSTLYGGAEIKKEVDAVQEDLNPYNYILINFEPWSVQKV